MLVLYQIHPSAQLFFASHSTLPSCVNQKTQDDLNSCPRGRNRAKRNPRASSLIGSTAIKYRRTPLNLNRKTFSNWSRNACLRAPFAGHDAQTPPPLIASGQILKFQLTSSKQTTTLFLIASFSASFARLRPRITNHKRSSTPKIKTAPQPFGHSAISVSARSATACLGYPSAIGVGNLV